MKISFHTTILALTAALLLAVAPGLTRPVTPRGPVRLLDDADPNATRDLIAHDAGHICATLSNWGETGNPDGAVGFRGFEYPIRSGNDFLFSGGVWVGAVVNGVRLVSTTTDGDNGTNEFYPVHIGSVPAAGESFNPDWHLTSNRFAEREGVDYVQGAFGLDDDGDWNAESDDLNEDGLPSRNWDGGAGILGFDDDLDGMIDEEQANGLDDDGDGVVDEDCSNGDGNGDGDAGYDPEPRIDEDPAGNMAADNLDNDHDGWVDDVDPDFDHDCCPLSNDDDGDGLNDEDGDARADQVFRTVYHDDISGQFVGSPDGDGHTPLNVQVSQRSSVWSSRIARDIVLFEFEVRNMGQTMLENVHLAYFTDPDIGAAGEGGDAASLDDYNYYDSQRQMMVQYDSPDDNDGWEPGAFAVKVVKPPVPWASGSFSFRNFERVAGGDPEFNSDKFNMISSGQISPPSYTMGDWRMLMGWGSAADNLTLAPGASLSFAVAMIAAENTQALNRTADRLPVYDTGPSIGAITLYTSPTSLGPWVLSAPVSDNDGVNWENGVWLHRRWQGHEAEWSVTPPYSWVWMDRPTASGEYYFLMDAHHANGSPAAPGDVIQFHVSGEDGFSNYSSQVVYSMVVGQGILQSHKRGSLPADFALRQNYPNPFNATTTIAFSLPLPGRVRVAVYDLLGREVAVLADGDFAEGEHKVMWNAQGVSSGMYLARLSGVGATVTRKLVLLR